MPLGSEERFAKIFRASPTPMAIVALDGRHLDVNESWLRTFGYTREEVVAKTPAELGLFLVRSEETYGVLHEIARSQSLDDVEMVLRTSAGIERIGLVSIQLIDLEGETCALSTFVDITERKRAERRARTQYAITRLLAESSALDHAIPRLLETIGRGFEWDAAELWQEDPASGRLACAGTWAREIPGFPDLSAGRTFARGEGLPGKVWADAEPLWMPDVSVDPRFLRGSAAARAGLRSAFAVPIRSDRLVGGVMVFFGRAIRPPDEDLILTMADLGLQIGHFTERRRAEDALAKTTVQYERLVHSIDGIVWEADAQSFRFTFVSSKAERLLGYPVARWRDDVAFWRDHIHPDDRDRTVALCVEATRQLRDHEFDYRMIAADGRSVWLHDVVTVVVEDGRAVKLRGVMVDITARKQVEAEREQLLIREQEARREAEAARNRLAFLVRATGVLASSLEYRATLSNVVRVAIPQLADGAAFYLFGEGGEIELVELAHADTELEEEAMAWAKRYRVDPSSGHPAAIMRRTGEPFFVAQLPSAALSWSHGDADFLAFLDRLAPESVVAAPVRARGRVIGALMWFCRASSARHYSLEDLALVVELAQRAALALDNARLYADAQEANRMKDEFLATLSHELRTPLNAILGWVQLLREDALDEGDRGSALASIERNAELQTRLVSDLLDVSRIISGKLSLETSPIDLAPIVLAALETVRPAAEAKGISLDAALDGRANLVDGDPDRLQQVVWNLLSNAIKFTPRGGQVTVAVAQSGGNVELRVRDTGEGISSEFAPHLFERFRQADSSTTRPHGGLGLGLALARHLVELHGGVVHAASEGLGRGATFIVRLPAAGAANRSV